MTGTFSSLPQGKKEYLIRAVVMAINTLLTFPDFSLFPDCC
jgi:hypothetical protein